MEVAEVILHSFSGWVIKEICFCLAPGLRTLILEPSHNVWGGTGHRKGSPVGDTGDSSSWALSLWLASAAETWGGSLRVIQPQTKLPGWHQVEQRWASPTEPSSTWRFLSKVNVIVSHRFCGLLLSKRWPEHPVFERHDHKVQTNFHLILFYWLLIISLTFKFSLKEWTGWTSVNICRSACWI